MCVERRGYARRSLSPTLDIEVRLLGLVEADLDGRAVALGGVKQRALLAMLALHANTPVSADRLMEGLWGDELPASAPKMVQLYVSQLRKLLGSGEARIVTLGRAYELRLPVDAVDAVRFEHLIDEAARGDARASQLASEALALWRGPPLDDVAAEPFAAAEIRRLQELWLHAREMVIGAALAAGEHDAVLTELEDLVVTHPLREHLHAQWMLALYRCGRQAEALEAYRRARELLVDEIGVEPGPELRRLHEQILDHDPALEVHASKPVAAGAQRPRLADRLAPHGRPLVIGGALLLVAAIAVIVLELTRGRSAPGPMAGGPDSVAMIDPSTGRVKAQIRVGSRPVAIAASSGAVWVANADDGTVSRVDENTERVVKTIGIGDPLSDVEAGGGAVWVAGGTSGRLTAIDPRQNAVSRTFGLQGDNELLPKATLAVAVGARGVWTTNGPDRVLRLDPATEQLAAVPVAAGPFALAAGPHSVWAGSFRRITRIESATNRVTATIPVATGAPFAVAVGAGAVWVAGGQANAVWRIDPYSAAVTATVAVGRIASGIAIAGGSVWVTNYADGTVSRIDARSNRVVDTIAVGDGPVDVAAGGRGIWVAVQRRDLT